jgi:lipopolysaccharide export system permease protein
MSQLYKYIISNLSSTFFPIFFTLFSITSIIFLVKIATLTSIITMDLKELLFLYSLKIPLILFYTLPITFFVSSIISIARLSSEYELIVITSFGLSPLKIVKIFIPISLLFSFALFLLSFILIPKSDYIENSFINKKKQEARFNIKPSEYGQKFGPWYMYVQSKKNDDYKNIILYQNENNKDTFVIASKANIKNNQTSLSLKLHNGTSSVISDSLKYVEFNTMQLNSHLKQEEQISTLKDLINYWLKNRTSSKTRTMFQNIFISLLPLISILFYISLGYYNPRYNKNYSTLFGILFIIIYVIIMKELSLKKDIYLLYVFPSIWILISIIIYFIRIRRFY